MRRLDLSPPCITDHEGIEGAPIWLVRRHRHSSTHKIKLRFTCCGFYTHLPEQVIRYGLMVHASALSRGTSRSCSLFALSVSCDQLFPANLNCNPMVVVPLSRGWTWQRRSR